MKKKLNFYIALLSVVIICVNIFGACSSSTNWETHLAYTVRFHDNFEGDYAKADVEVGKTVSLPKAPSRTGYAFKGWYLSYEDDATLVFDVSKPINSNLTVYAKWEKDSSVSIITLKFLNYSTKDATYSVGNGAVFSAPQNPIYNNDKMYDFVNWYSDKACTLVYDFSSSVNSDITLYAGWVQKKAYLKLDYNFAGCSAPKTVIVQLGSASNISEIPTRAQYEFGGWYTARVGGLPFNINQPITENITIYAHWSRSEYMVSFDVNGAILTPNTQTSFVVKRDSSVAEVANAVAKAMSFEGHNFEGWYLSKTDPDSEAKPPESYLADLSKVSEDMVIYAAWTLQSYKVQFDYNFAEAPQAPASQDVRFGKLATQPAVTNRDGYIFGGWFLDKVLSNQFTFDMPISGNIILFAKWVEDTGTQTKITVNYTYNLGAGNVNHATKLIEFNGTADSDSPATPVVKDYYFAGWYEDSAFTKVFNPKRNLIEDITIYGKMLKKHTFEAEAIDFTGKVGQGTSTNSNEEGMIMDSTFVNGGNVSNGYFARELYYQGAMLDFEIMSDKAVTDAVLFLRISSESYEFFSTKEKDGIKYNYLSEEQLKIVVNDNWTNGETKPDTWLKYGGLYMPMANTIDKEDLSKNKTPFEDMLIISGLKLKEGRNIITLLVDNNNNHGGTFHAEAPTVDCMYIYSSANLTMKDYEFYKRDNVNRG